MKKSNLPVPVVMYHSVGRVIEGWEWDYLTVPADIFEDHLFHLRQAGYQTIDLHVLRAYVLRGEPLPERVVVLTFDDGYLDNWTYVSPLLEKYGFTGTVFVNPEFVDTTEEVRPTMKDVWSGKKTEEEIPVHGFMSWSELQRLASRGPLDIQSHSMTHTWYPCDPKVVDFFDGSKAYYWLKWNERREDKPFYLQNCSEKNTAPGTPVYEHGKSLAVRRYFPAEEEQETVMRYVAEHGGSAFFYEGDWKERLFLVIRNYREKHGDTGSFETEAEQFQRFSYELVESKRILQDKLKKAIDFLCWPGGGYGDMARKIALDNYQGVTLASSDTMPVKNIPGDDPRFIRRLGIPCLETSAGVQYFGGKYFVKYIQEFQGVKGARRYRQALKLTAMLRNGLRRPGPLKKKKNGASGRVVKN